MGLFGDDKPFIRQDKFDPWQRQGWSSFERIIRLNKNLTPQNKKQILSTLKSEFKNGRRQYNVNILHKFKKLSPNPNSYSLAVKLRKALHADPKTGLSPEQIKRNINLMRWERGDHDLERSRKEGGGAGRRAGTVDRVVNQKGGRLTTMASDLSHGRMNPMGRFNRENNDMATAGGEKYQDSVGQFAGLEKGTKLDPSGHVSITKAVENKGKNNAPGSKVTNLNDFKNRKMGGGPPAGFIPFSKAA